MTKLNKTKKIDSEKFSRSVAFRVTQSEFSFLEKKFLAAGMTQSEFCRDHVFRNTTQVVAKPPSPSTSERAVFLLSKASNNLNQLAHRANSAHLKEALASDELGAITEQLRLLNSFMLSQVKEASK